MVIVNYLKLVWIRSTFLAYSEDISPLNDSCGGKWWREESTELGMIKFLVRSMHLETDQDLAQMKKTYPKKYLFRYVFHLGYVFFASKRCLRL